MPATVAPKKEMGPVPVEKLHPHKEEDINKIEDTSFYRCRLQMGPSWRRHGGMSVKREGNTVKFTPSVYDTEVLTGSVVKGLMVGQNQWLKWNRLRRPEGDITRMVVVLDVNETDEIPTENIDPTLALGKVIGKAMGAEIAKLLQEMKK